MSTPIQNESLNVTGEPPTYNTTQQWRQVFNYTHNYRLNYNQKVRTTGASLNLTANKSWGDEMIYPKQKNTFRLFSQNINGLKIDEKGGDLIPISEFLTIYQCDMVGFSEINLDVSKYKARKILTDTVNRAFDANLFSASTSEIPFESLYQPGGTLTAVFNNPVCRVNSKYSDKMGRWSTISLTGKRKRLVHFLHRLPIGG